MARVSFQVLFTNCSNFCSCTIAFVARNVHISICDFAWKLLWYTHRTRGWWFGSYTLIRICIVGSYGFCSSIKTVFWTARHASSNNRLLYFEIRLFGWRSEFGLLLCIQWSLLSKTILITRPVCAKLFPLHPNSVGITHNSPFKLNATTFFIGAFSCLAKLIISLCHS